MPPTVKIGDTTTRMRLCTRPVTSTYMSRHMSRYYLYIQLPDTLPHIDLNIISAESAQLPPILNIVSLAKHSSLERPFIKSHPLPDAVSSASIDTRSVVGQYGIWLWNGAVSNATHASNYYCLIGTPVHFRPMPFSHSSHVQKIPCTAHNRKVRQYEF